MIINPLRPQSARPVAVLYPGWKSLRVVTADDDREHHGPVRCFEALAKLEDHTLYVPANLRTLVRSTGARAWTADVWRGRATSMHLYGTKVKVLSLRRSFTHLEPRPAFDALAGVLSRLADQGVKPGSVSSMAWALWRSTLRGPLELSASPKVTKVALFGGRQGALPPHSYSDYVALDIKKAYGHAMGTRPYAGLLREVATSTRLDPSVAGLARARVTVPDDLPFAPLPTRLSADLIQWSYGEVEGTWPWVELAAAAAIGCRVEVLRCWAPATEIDPFAAWWRLVQTLGDDHLTKSVINSLWGSFALSDEGAATVRWVDDLGEQPERIERPRRNLPQVGIAHVAAETTARVRSRMLLEGLYGDPVYEPVHVDTDGILVPRESMANRVLGDGPGQWRLKAEMSWLDLRAPQLYRYTCGPRCGVEHSRFHYVASGVPAHEARTLFEGEHPGFQIAITDRDAVVPSAHRFDEIQVARYEIATDRLRRIVFGEPIDAMRRVRV